MLSRWNGKTFHCIAPLEIRGEQVKERIVEYWCTKCERASVLQIISNVGSFKKLRTKIKFHEAKCEWPNCGYPNVVDLRRVMD